MAIQNITGRKLKAKEPTLPIQTKTACSSGTSSHGRSVRTSWLLRELPIPSMIPQKESNATGNMKVFPSCWKNSHKVILFAVFAVIT